MNNILESLFAAKAAVLREDEARESYDEVIARAHARQHERRPFRLALEQAQPFGFIAEIKQASPSLGVIVEDFDPAAIARTYKAAGVHAVSVLTEESGFRGDLRYLNIVRSTVDLPLLRKDFLSTPYQIAQAAAYGADAVLLIVAGLDDEQLHDLILHAQRFDLDALVEVHDAEEAERARAAGATFVGINNRDLRTFTVNLATTEELLPLLPDTAFIVAESGIHTASDIRRLHDAGAKAFLIGESMMRSPDPIAFADVLRSGAQ